MEKGKLLPSLIVSLALLVSSIILWHGMHTLGNKVINAGIYSSNISLQNANNRGPLWIELDKDSKLELLSSQEPDDQ